MNDLVKSFYNSKNDIFGKPQRYKDIDFYPLKISDTEYLDLFYKIFQHPKNYIPDKTIIRMSYLKFVTQVIQYSINPDGHEMQDSLVSFLKFITKTKEEVTIFYDIDQNEQNRNPERLFESILVNIKIGDKIFTEYEFDTIREIVLLQNGLSTDYIESYNPELEKFLEFENRRYKDLSFEDEIWIFCSVLRKTIKEIEDYTLYQFKKHMERLLLVYNYDLYSPLEISGQISSKDGKEIVKHYMTHFEETGRYSNILIKQDSFVEDNPKLFNSDFLQSQ